MKPELFGLFDILIGCGWLILICSIFWFIRLKNLDKQHYKYFYPALLFKLVFGLLFGFTYTKILEGGGDTIAYWDGAVNLNKLFWESPSAYFAELLQTPSPSTISKNFSIHTGFPPSWIYYEPESFFICKIFSLFTFLTFNSYIAITLLISTISFYASWKFYELIKDFEFCPKWVFPVAALFIPTVAFWCSGIAKDTIILIAFLFMITALFSVLLGKDKRYIYNFIILLIMAFLLYRIRDFMLIAIGAPLALVLSIRIAKNISDNTVLLWTVRITGALLLISLPLLYLQGTLNESATPISYLEEVAIIQQDFAQNKLYTGYRYDLGITDYSPMGMIKASPLSLITAFYRPFIWEANSGFLLLSGLENLLLIYFTIKFFFFSGGIFKQIRYIRNQEFLVFAILFSLCLGFFVGFTSGLFNVLVRFKAPYMALLFLFFASRKPKEKEVKVY